MSTWITSDPKVLQKKPKGRFGRRHKMNARPTVVHGLWFGSRGEAARYCELKALQDRGDIAELECQPVFKFPTGVKYVADFRYVRKPKTVVIEDVKGFETPVFKLKMKDLAYFFPNTTVEMIKMASKKVDVILKLNGACDAKPRRSTGIPCARSGKSRTRA